MARTISTEAQIFRYFVGGRQSLFLAHHLATRWATKRRYPPYKKFIIPENLWFST